MARDLVAVEVCCDGGAVDVVAGSALSWRRGQLGIVRLVSCLARLALRFSLSVLPGFLPAGRCGDLSGMVVPHPVVDELVTPVVGGLCCRRRASSWRASQRQQRASGSRSSRWTARRGAWTTLDLPRVDRILIATSFEPDAAWTMVTRPGTMGRPGSVSSCTSTC